MAHDLLTNVVPLVRSPFSRRTTSRPPGRFSIAKAFTRETVAAFQSL